MNYNYIVCLSLKVNKTERNTNCLFSVRLHKYYSFNYIQASFDNKEFFLNEKSHSVKSHSVLYIHLV